MTGTRYTDMAGRPFGDSVGSPPDANHPFKVYVQLKGETPKSNGLSFETVEDAKAYGRDLLSRWFVPIGFEVRNELTGEVVS